MLKVVGYLTDPHGKVKTYRKFFELCQSRRVRIGILGGDLTPKFAVIRLADGTRIPVNLVLKLRDSQAGTFVKGLECVRSSSFEYDGLYEHRVDDLEVDFERIYREQVILHKLFEALGNEFRGFSFEDRERVFIERHIKPIIEQLEERGLVSTAVDLLRIRERCPRQVRSPDRDLKMSAVLLPGLYSFSETRAMADAGNRSQAIERLEAKQILSCYPPIYILLISEHSLFCRLKQEAEKHQEVAQAQRSFLATYLLPAVEQLTKQGIKVYAQFGNDDVKENEDLLVAANDSGILGYINQRAVPLDDRFWIAGYSYVNPIPGEAYAGWQKWEDEIECDLEQLFCASDPRKTVYVFHAPPFGTALDLTNDRQHIGSTAVSRAIAAYNPYLLLSGHAHASRLISGRFYERIGQTHAFQPGGIHDAFYGGADALFFDLLDPTRHWHSASSG